MHRKYRKIEILSLHPLNGDDLFSERLWIRGQTLAGSRQRLGLEVLRTKAPPTICFANSPLNRGDRY